MQASTPSLIALAAAAALFAPQKASATRALDGPKIEVTFVLDATGSMSPYIKQAREQVKSIAAELASGQPAPDVRFALVAYRDRGDDYITKVEAFSKDADVMKKHLDATEAQGGGDHPEAALEGLKDAIDKLDWSVGDDNVIKMIYLIGDAPAQHYANGPTEKSVAKAAREKNIVIHSIACGRMNKAGNQTWSQLARWTEGRTFHLGNAKYAARPGGISGAAASGGIERASLAAAVGGSARAYSTSVGVDYGAGQAIEAQPMDAASATKTGLRGPHVRWIRDPVAWRDVWAAHNSTRPLAERRPLPEVDFTSHAVIVAGGSGGALAIDEVRVASDVRAAHVTPSDGDGAAFVIVPLTREGGAK